MSTIIGFGREPGNAHEFESEPELQALLRLIYTPGLGAVRLRRLLTQFTYAQRCLRGTGAQWAAARVSSGLLRAAQQVDGELIASAMRKLHHHRVSTVSWCHPDYPLLLKHIFDPPAVLFMRGGLRKFARPCIAVVGSRRATGTGLAIAARLGAELAGAGCVVVSGLALGIDAAAHRGALAAGGLTVAVGACGAEIVYPKKHLALAQQIAETGALVTEFAPGTKPAPGNFPKRNRVISGLCHGVVVVEAAARSGSLITARLALEQGREVFAVPGSVLNPLAQGCHELLRDGAQLIDRAEQILTEIAPQLAPTCVQELLTEDVPAGVQGKLLTQLRAAPCDIETLVAITGLDVTVVLRAVQELQLAGFAQSGGGGVWSATS